MDEERKNKREKKENKICKVEKCNSNSYWKNGGENGYCRKHYQQFYKYGKILKRTRRDPNEIIDCGDYCEICLYKKQKLGEESKEINKALIDKEDLEKIRQYRWSLTIHGYVKNNYFYLHQLILGKKKGYVIDHINHDTLNNRKQNLRFVTRQQNGMNKKNIKGYYWSRKNNKWIAQIKINKKAINLGSFINEQDVINARKEAEQKYFGEFAYKKIN